MPHRTTPFLYRALRDRVSEFFPPHLHPQIKRLYLSTAVLNGAVAMVSLLEPIYLYTLGVPVWQIMALYAAVYAIYFFIIPLGGKFVKQHGFSHGILYGSVFLVVYYSFLFLVAYDARYLVAAAVALACQKACYWPGFHAQFAFFGRGDERGREISNIAVLSSIATVIGPLFGGVIVAQWGFPVLFIVSSSVILLSNLPLLTVREVFTPSHHLSYRETYQSLIAPENRKYFFGFLGYAEELVEFTVWPIVLFVVVGGVLNVGGFLTLSMALTTIIVLLIGRVVDRCDRHILMRWGAASIVVSWILRLCFYATPKVFWIDFTARAAKSLFTFPLVAGLYEHAVKTSVVRTVLFFEMSLTVGKFLTAASLSVLFYVYGEQWWMAFTWASVMAGLYLLLGMKKKLSTLPFV